MTPSRNGHRTDGWPVDDREANGYRAHGYVYGVPESDTTPYPGAGQAGYGRDAAGYGRDVAGHGRDVAGHGRDVAGHGRDVAGHGRDVAGYGYRQAAEPATELFTQTSGTPMPARSPELFLDEPPQVTPPPPLRSATRTLPADRAGWSAIGAPATPPAAPPPTAAKGPRLRVDWPNCKAHGLCHELLPEAIRLDEWGYPIVGRDALPEDLLDDARRAVMSCPTLALHIID